MANKDRQRIINKLRYYSYIFDDDTIEYYLALIETYNDYELRSLFTMNSDISIFLEDFLARCYNVKLYMNNFGYYEISAIENVLTGDVGGDFFLYLFGYYSNLALMADYFTNLKIVSKSKELYDSVSSAIYYSKVLRNAFFGFMFDDEICAEAIAGFVNVYTTQLEDIFDEFLGNCYISCMDNNIFDLETDFINYNERKLEILSNDNRTYDKIIERIIIRINKISDNIEESQLKIISKSILDFQVSHEYSEEKRQVLRKILERDLIR